MNFSSGDDAVIYLANDYNKHLIKWIYTISQFEIYIYFWSQSRKFVILMVLHEVQNRTNSYEFFSYFE